MIKKFTGLTLIILAMFVFFGCSANNIPASADPSPSPGVSLSSPQPSASAVPQATGTPTVPDTPESTPEPAPSPSPASTPEPSKDSNIRETPATIKPAPTAKPEPTLKPTIAPSPTPSPSAKPQPAPVIESPGTTVGFRFVVMADSRGLDKGINSKIVRKTLEEIKKLSPQPKFALMQGDLVDGAKSFEGVKSQLEYFKKTVTEYYPIDFFYPGMGNHEVMHDSGGEKAFGEVFSEFRATFLEGYNRTIYTFDYENTRFFMLNTNYPGETHVISDRQLDWVKSNIDPAKEHNMFFMHEPPYPTGSGVGNSLDRNRLQRNKLWQVVDSSENPLVFAGHEHNYSRRHIDSDFNETVGDVEFKYGKTVYQLVTGSFGAPLYTHYYNKKNVDVPPTPQYHYAVVDINRSKLKVVVYNLEGEKLDEFEQ